LADENTRWARNIEELTERLQMLIGDSLLAAAFISYIGAFSYLFRQNLWRDIWLEDMKTKAIPMSLNVDPLYIIVTEADIAKWKNQKLPSDQVSYENAAILTSCTRWPLIIDPQKQGIEWLINKAEDEKYEMPKIQVPGTKNWTKEVVRCVRDGLTLMIENAGEEFAPSLDPVLAKRYIQIGKRFVIKFDDEDLDVNDNFRLYIQTKLSNPHYRPEITAQCTIINFIVTEKGLEDQMLAIVVDLENGELEAKRESIVKAQNANKWELQVLEKTLLKNLSEADPDTILENQELVLSLEGTKTKATEIAQQQEISKKIEEEINTKRELYRRVAAEGSTLFFLLMQLAFVNRMYQYSLDSFYKFFRYAINRTKPCDEMEKRIIGLRNKIRYKIYQWVRRGLFEKHRQIFLTQITLRLMQKGVLTEPYRPKEVDFLLKAQPKTDGPKPPDWMQEKHWQLCVALSQLEGFENFSIEVEKNGVRFKEWYNDLTPETTPLPSDWKRAPLFHMLLILRCMRRDRITMGLNRLIVQALPNGAKFIAAETSYTDIMNKSYKMSGPHTPFFYILSPGSAPKQIVEDLVKAQHPKDFKSLSMGQGMDKDAEEYLARGHKEGIWLFLENCHLMPKWLPKLENILDTYALEGGHDSFRLFLSGEPSDRIPIGLLERCIKLTFEPPQELKANVQMAFKTFPKKDFEDKSEKYRCVLFALCFFHGLVVVRKRFGSTGWNGNYPFNLQDLRDSAKVMETYLEGNKVPWDDMKYIIGEIMYGGHITDDWDRKLCKAYLDFLMREELFDEMDLIPYPPKNSSTSFKCPKVPSYDAYFSHINVLPETPLTFGMSPNAELNYREDQADTLFSTLQDLQPKDLKGGAEQDGAQQEKFKDTKDMVEKFDSQRIPPDLLKGDENRSPFQNVFLQEADRMNSLITDILSSMNDLELALSGQLTMTETLDKLQDCLIMYRVPDQWQKYESMRTLLPWLTNLGYRIEQLNNWKDNSGVAPKILYINYLFNPQAFLTAIKQTEAQRSKIELNKLYIQTEITGKKPENVEGGIDQSLKKAAIGVNIYGMFLEGCKIDINSKFLDESEPKKLLMELPVVICRAAPVPPEGKEDKNFYICPVYKTKKRGPTTFVFTAQLKTKDPSQKWTLAGAAIILDAEDDLSKPFFGK
jgi:dynein heavy chain